jgi:hypothetical protein
MADTFKNNRLGGKGAFYTKTGPAVQEKAVLRPLQ